jgi:hypothetical protein
VGRLDGIVNLHVDSLRVEPRAFGPRHLLALETEESPVANDRARCRAEDARRIAMGPYAEEAHAAWSPVKKMRQDPTRDRRERFHGRRVWPPTAVEFRGNKFMRNERSEMLSRLVRERKAMETRREAEARATAHDLIQLHVGPDDRIADVETFYSALVQAIRAARWQGETDRSREDVLSLG